MTQINVLTFNANESLLIFENYLDLDIMPSKQEQEQ